MKKIFFSTALLLYFLACNGEYSMEYTGKRNRLFCDGKAVDFMQCAIEQIRRYPESEIQDLVKLAYQAAWGPAHGIRSREQAWQYFSREFAMAETTDAIPLFEVISPDYCRVNLGAWKKAGLPGKWLFNMFCASAEILPDSQRIFDSYICNLDKLAAGRKKELDDFMKQYRGGAVHHSAHYRRKYHPSYRLINIRFITAVPVLLAAAKIPEKAVSIIVIDGRAASGKTTLARQLALILEAETIHMDDFFLPKELRTAERLSEPGGNIHYERFKQEVLLKLSKPEPFSYQRFDCAKMQLGPMQRIAASRWRIVEGAYSLHPIFGNYADLKLFFDISQAEQLKRIRKRNGEKMAQIFEQRWIPMEEKYINDFSIKSHVDLILPAGGVPFPALN